MITPLNPRNNRMADFGLSPGAMSHGIVFAGGMALDLDTVQRVPEADTIANETRLCLEEIEEIVTAAGGTKRDIVKVTCFLTDDSYRGEFIQAFRDFFAPGPFPARATYVAGIAGGCRVEMEAVAVVPQDKK
jgi:2-iminobutanoate/2-iminopropanoate deaminase